MTKKEKNLDKYYLVATITVFIYGVVYLTFFGALKTFVISAIFSILLFIGSLFHRFKLEILFFLPSLYIFFVSYFLGGHSSPVLIWVCIIPMWGMYLGINHKISLLAAIIPTFIFFMINISYSTPSEINQPANANFLAIIGSSVFSFLITNIFKNEVEKKAYQLEGLNRDLLQSQAALVESEKMATIGLLSASISHEIGNALGRIKPAILELENKHGTPKFEAYLPKFFRIAKLGVNHAERVMQSLRLASGSESEVVSFNLSSTVEDAKSLCGSKLNGIDFSNKIEKDIVVKTSQVVLIQTLINLILNAAYAIKDSQGPGLTSEEISKLIKEGRTEELAMMADNKQGSISIQYKDGKLSVVDDGPGVPQNVRDKMFSETITTKPLGVGNGIGLYVSKKQLQKYNCDLVLEDSDNGAKFTIIIG